MEKSGSPVRSMTFEEFKAEVNKPRFWDKIFPHGILGYYAGHILIRPWIIMREIAVEIKWAWQRVFRGWDDKASWSVDIYLARLIPQLMRKLKNAQAIPIGMWDGLEHDENYNYGAENDKVAMQRWQTILDDIAVGFEDYENSIENPPYKPSEKFEKAFDLLREHFMELND